MAAPRTPRAARTALLLLAAILPASIAYKPTFTGSITVDFPGGTPGVLFATDLNGDVALGSVAATGWEVLDVRYAYDRASDTAYFGKERGIGPPMSCPSLGMTRLLLPFPCGVGFAGACLPPTALPARVADAVPRPCLRAHHLMNAPFFCDQLGAHTTRRT